MDGPEGHRQWKVLDFPFQRLNVDEASTSWKAGCAVFELQPESKGLGNLEGFPQAPRGRAYVGVDSRRRYSAREKVNVVMQLCEVEGRTKEVKYAFDLVAQQYVAEKTGVSVPNICKLQLVENDVMLAASDTVLKNLKAKSQQKRWFPAADERLYTLNPARAVSSRS